MKEQSGRASETLAGAVVALVGVVAAAIGAGMEFGLGIGLLIGGCGLYLGEMVRALR